MCSTRAYVVRGVRVPITSSALKSNNAATFPVLPSFHIKKILVRIFWILSVYITEATIPAE